MKKCTPTPNTDKEPKWTLTTSTEIKPLTEENGWFLAPLEDAQVFKAKGTMTFKVNIDEKNKIIEALDKKELYFVDLKTGKEYKN